MAAGQLAAAPLNLLEFQLPLCCFFLKAQGATGPQFCLQPCDLHAALGMRRLGLLRASGEALDVLLQHGQVEPLQLIGKPCRLGLRCRMVRSGLDQIALGVGFSLHPLGLVLTCPQNPYQSI